MVVLPVLGLLKKLFGAGGAAQIEVHQGDSTEHKGFTITPVPTKQSAGWRVEGTIERNVDGELKSHHFIRADTYFNLDDTLATTLSKARRLVDEQGDRIFGDSP
jgi:hypothetical protein